MDIQNYYVGTEKGRKHYEQTVLRRSPKTHHINYWRIVEELADRPHGLTVPQLAKILRDDDKNIYKRLRRMRRHGFVVSDTKTDGVRGKVAINRLVQGNEPAPLCSGSLRSLSGRTKPNGSHPPSSSKVDVPAVSTAFAGIVKSISDVSDLMGEIRKDLDEARSELAKLATEIDLDELQEDARNYRQIRALIGGDSHGQREA